ncbi:MAG: type ISP restriction/modification enzyme, partial [Bacteroidales bacterium]
ESGKVWINSEQYFDNVPQVAWEFYIGGYQPAQKWLKDRKGRTLTYDDILHYQKIIVALSETDRLMKEIDKIDIN